MAARNTRSGVSGAGTQPDASQQATPPVPEAIEPAFEPGEDKSGSKLVVPALRAHMGDWTYYIAFMRLRDLAHRVQIAAEIHKSERLREMIQRELKENRAKAVADYLLTQPQRFFNTVVVGVYGGEPRFYELAVRSGQQVSAESLPEYVEGAFGVLELSGDEVLFALDGQHRIVGIQVALQRADAGSLGDEEQSTIFVAHKRTPDGLERTRRLFSTLNRHAKPVSKKEIIALDEDDVIAIITRRLVDEYPLFEGKKTSTRRTSSLPANDSLSFTTITTLYDALDAFLRTRQNWTAVKRTRPPEETILQYQARAEAFFDTLVRTFRGLGQLARASDEEGVPGKYRSDRGGNLLFRPVGILLITKAIRALMDQGWSLKQAADGLRRTPLDLNRDPWVNLLWDPVNRRMATKSEEQNAALRILVYGAGGDLRPMNSSEAKLRKQLSGIKKVPARGVQLERFG